MKKLFVWGLFLLLVAGPGCGPSRFNSTMLFARASVGGTGKLQCFFINTLNGDSTLLRLPDGKAVLIDGGYKGEGRHILKCLQALGISELEAVILTHSDADHYRGLTRIFKRIPVRHFYYSGVGSWPKHYREFIKAVDASGCDADIIREGDPLPLSPNLDCQVLWPPVTAHSMELSPHLSNTYSIVLRISYDSFSLLFVGDIKDDSEKTLRTKYGPALKADILKVAHHGSGSSSDRKFLETVDPRFAVIMGEWYNIDFEVQHKPSPRVIKRLKDVCERLIRTHPEGAFFVETDGSAITRMFTAKDLLNAPPLSPAASPSPGVTP
ncbi:ComEC/Rec2 family competence protein [Planctomycetota bacterium]